MLLHPYRNTVLLCLLNASQSSFRGPVCRVWEETLVSFLSFKQLGSMWHCSHTWLGSLCVPEGLEREGLPMRIKSSPADSEVSPQRAFAQYTVNTTKLAFEAGICPSGVVQIPPQKQHCQGMRMLDRCSHKKNQITKARVVFMALETRLNRHRNTHLLIPTWGKWWHADRRHGEQQTGCKQPIKPASGEWSLGWRCTDRTAAKKGRTMSVILGEPRGSSNP